MFGFQVLTVVAAVIGGLFFISLVFGVLAVYQHVRQEREQRKERLLHDRWDPLLVEIMNGDRLPEDLHRKVDPTTVDAFLDYLVSYSIVVTGDAQSRIVELAEPWLEEFEDDLSAADPALRARALYYLGRLGSERNQERLIEALQDPSSFVAMTAARMLLRQERTAGVRAVIDVLPRLMLYGSQQLTSLLASGGAQLIPVLRATYADADQPAGVRALIGDALRWNDDPPSADIAAEVLETAEDRELLAASLRLLQRVGGREHAPIVRSFSLADDEVLRLHAVTALGRIGTQVDVPLLADALHDPSRWVARRAAWALRDLNAMDPLQKLVATDSPRAVLAKQIMGG